MSVRVEIEPGGRALRGAPAYSVVLELEVEREIARVDDGRRVGAAGEFHRRQVGRDELVAVGVDGDDVGIQRAAFVDRRHADDDSVLIGLGASERCQRHEHQDRHTTSHDRFLQE